MSRTPYPSDVSDDEWAFVAPYLTLMTETAPQREHSLREVFNGLRWLVRAGASWRMMPHDLPPYFTVFQQTGRWLKAGVFEAIVHDLRQLCASPWDEKGNRRQLFSIRAPCNRHPNLERVPSMTERNGGVAVKPILLLIRWAICWL
jgi:transposase